eukprot:GHRR01018518.1.p2 GENE.GHRR01018518.1~~GHRR01018518.1.p2  ORF type:complete len:248 (+),score=69.50 GHRR01018518.1:1346-2089(+)
MAFFAQGLKIGKVPFELWSGGKTYWQHIKDSPRHAATFNTAMHQINQIGGTAVANSRVWRQFDHVIDVAGGVGGFMADILDLNLHLRGVVFDQASQIESAHKVWRATHRRLMPRVELIAGDMFDPSTLPSPSDSSCKVAYTLRNILHDWSDTDSVAILKAIRSRISAGNIALGLVKLLIIEVTTVEEVLPCLMGPRRGSDMTMLMSFGDGKERNKQEFEALLALSGFKLQRIIPTCGAFLVLEAVPI